MLLPDRNDPPLSEFFLETANYWKQTAQTLKDPDLKEICFNHSRSAYKRYLRVKDKELKATRTGNVHK